VTTELQPARIAAAHREGTRLRLIRSDRIPEEIVDRWMAAWEASSKSLRSRQLGVLAARLRVD
jgi:hypothetical protein